MIWSFLENKGDNAVWSNDLSRFEKAESVLESCDGVGELALSIDCELCSLVIHVFGWIPGVIRTVFHTVHHKSAVILPKEITYFNSIQHFSINY